MAVHSWQRKPLKLARRTAWKLRPPTLALGGGGARGFAHIGVLLELDHAGLPVRAIAGTSMGAVVGAMYAGLGSAKEVYERWQQTLERNLIPDAPRSKRNTGDRLSENPLIQAARKFRNRLVVSFALHKTTMLDYEPLIKALEFLLPEVTLESLRPQFMAVATNLESGEETRLFEGPLRHIIQASSAIPGVFPSVEIEGSPLVDGGVAAEVPVLAARSMGLPVMAVDVSINIPPLSDDDIALDTMTRGQTMTARLLRQHHLDHARWVLRPQVGDTVWSDWQAFDDLVECGRTAMRSWLDGES